MTTRTETKSRSVTLYFESKEGCTKACESLGLSLRKVTDIDKNHGGNYSKMTGHYGMRYQQSPAGGHALRVALRSKLLLDEDIWDSMSHDERSLLGHIELKSAGW